jgi:hypothetical protein
MNSEEEILKKIPIDKVYDDALSPAMKQIGSALEKTVKASRFILAPIDYIATYHDRWERYLKKISKKVDEKNLTPGHPQIIIPVLEGLILSYENTLLSEFFINLLANSIDKTKQNLAHPAFPKIIQQLSHDEAVILYFLKKRKFKVTQQFDFDHSKHLISNMRIINNEFPLNKLQFPENLFLYLDHLHSLNIAGMWKTKDEAIIDKKINDQVGGYVYNEISLTKFGELFVDSCAPDKFIWKI